MANDQNLIPFNALPADRHREISQKGGKASGAAQRARRELINTKKVEQAAA